MRTFVIAIVLAAVSAAALAQYSASDPRSNVYNNESLRREDEIKRNEEAAKRQSDGGQSGAGASVGSQNNAARNAQTHAEFKAARARLLKMAPLPDDRNPLLGRWRVESRAMGGAKNDMQRLMGMLSNPGGAVCEVTFGGGITEFRSKSWASIDGSGDDSLGPIAYRADGKRLWAIPDKGIELMGFEVAGPNRVLVINVEGCALVRVGAPAANAAASAATAQGNARTGAANSSVRPAAGVMPQVAAASVVVDGAAFRCVDGSLLHVSLCEGNTDDATCKLTELHLPGLQIGKMARRADIAARVKGCEAGGIRYGADDKPIFVR